MKTKRISKQEILIKIKGKIVGRLKRHTVFTQDDKKGWLKDGRPVEYYNENIWIWGS